MFNMVFKMRKEYILTFAATIISLLFAFLVIKLFAPGLLGLSHNQALVQVDTKVAPFYEGIFRQQDYQAKNYLIPDPFTHVRAKPLITGRNGMGPNDILGFRNKNVPNLADIVVIGDSQTYGNNAPIQFNYPSLLQSYLKSKQSKVYNMSTGGWGAIQYLYISSKAYIFRPRIIIVAFYTGNDSVDSFNLAYSQKKWLAIRPNNNLTVNSLPKIQYPPQQKDWWPVQFKDGIKTIFTPKLRLAANKDHPAIKAGYQLMARSAKEISSLLKNVPTQLVFTIIPTKETVYYKKIKQDGIRLPKAYQALINHEKKNTNYLRKQLKDIKNAKYIDLVEDLQNIALKKIALYPEDINGHPYPIGYAVIATKISKEIKNMLPDKPKGLVLFKNRQKQNEYLLVRGDQFFKFRNGEKKWLVI